MNRGLREREWEQEQCGDVGEHIPAGTEDAQAPRLSVPGGSHNSRSPVAGVKPMKGVGGGFRRE